MTTDYQLEVSLNKLFISNNNIAFVSSKIGRNARAEMLAWASRENMDDYESVRFDYNEELAYVNNEFIKKHKSKPFEKSMARGQKYPKYYISNNVSGFNVNQIRAHDAPAVENVMISNRNFRHNNKIMAFETGLYTRNYDRKTHEEGLRDTRELHTINRSYATEDIQADNPYRSSSSIMYDQLTHQ